jgi:gamma-glutamylcyclotransferase (GGCT)/AIG2-like uncharacterized protein YtfP
LERRKQVTKTTTHLIFVYGSLRRGSARAMSVKFPGAKFVGEARVQGSLYDLGAYPGLLLDNSNSLVIGEVYEVDDEMLDELDEYEASSDYWRQPVEISVGAERRTGWTYAPNPDSCSSRPLIASGDWIEFAKTKADWL